jgi:putative ABC transport system permease protein
MSSDERDRELKEELEGHLRMAAQDRMDRGEAPADAEANARREFGNLGLVQEVTRQAEGWAGLRRFAQDLQYGARVLRRNPTFAVVSIFTLALGIGASTAIFSVVYGVLLRPLPYEKPAQIVRIWEMDGKGNRISFSDANFKDVRSQNRSLQAVAEYQFGVTAVSGGSEARRVPAAYVSPDFFKVFRIQPMIGRGFSGDEQTTGGPSAALVSYSFWQDYLGKQNDLQLLKLNLDNHSVPVVGVLPPGFRFPGETQIWLSSEIVEKPTSRSAGGWQVVARVGDDMSLQRASAELNGIGSRIHQQFSQDTPMTGAVAVPLRAAMTDKARPALLVLMGVSGLLLLVACANVMNLMLAQAAARESELAVRSALGASRSRLVRQFLTESLLVCVAGAAAGIGLAYGGVRALLLLAPQNLARLDEVSVNVPVLLFALTTAMLVAAGLGMLTALRASSIEIPSAMTRGEKGSLGGGGNQRVGQLIVAGQVAVTLVLLVGAGLLGRSFLRVLSIDPGFRTDRVVTLDLSFSGGNENARRVVLLQRMVDELRRIPGIVEAGGSSDLPLQANYSDGTFALLTPQQLTPQARRLIQRFAWQKGQFGMADYKALEDFFTPLFADKSRTGQANYVVTTEGYFRALRIPLKSGRFFNASDTVDAPHVALVSESLARQTWPGRDPIGQTIEFGNMDGDLRLLTVVGVVGDVRGTSLENELTPIIYVNYKQRPSKVGEFSIALRTAGDVASTLSASRRVIHEVDPTVPVSTHTYTQVFSASLDTRRFNFLLVGIFAGAALLLAIAGVYGVLAYSVARRAREFGLRIALGASRSNLLQLVLRHAMATALVGLLIGGIAAFVLTRFMRSLLFEVRATDPATYFGVAAVLLTVALLAAYIPARRATRADPMVALRSE